LRVASDFSLLYSPGVKHHINLVAADALLKTLVIM